MDHGVLKERITASHSIPLQTPTSSPSEQVPFIREGVNKSMQKSEQDSQIFLQNEDFLLFLMIVMDDRVVTYPDPFLAAALLHTNVPPYGLPWKEAMLHRDKLLTQRRKVPPCHCLFKIESFSLLSKASAENYTSEELEAGGYQWTLSIYPTGNKNKDGQDHVSVYLNLMVSSSSLFPVGWEVNAIVNFFVYDFLRDEYFSYQDARTRHFHKLQTECGMSKFIDLISFNDPSNGYLIDDACVFGAEIFVIEPPSKVEYLSMKDEPPPLSYRWKLDNFSRVNLEKYESEFFLAGNYRWKLVFYPNGAVEGKGNSISLFLTVDASSIPPNTKLYVHCILRAKDQIKGQHAETKFYRHFSSSNPTWGSRMLVPLARLKDPTKGFLEGNSCVLEAEFKVLGLVKAL